MFGEIVECEVLMRSKRGKKYGFIIYWCFEYVVFFLRNGVVLRKCNEFFFYLSYGGFWYFCWFRYIDYDFNLEEVFFVLGKSKYEVMDFDSLLKEV